MDKKKKRLMIAIAGITVLMLASVAAYYGYMKIHYVTTDDARIDGTIVSVSTQITGKISDIYVQEGDLVRAGQNIIRQADLSLAASANIDLAVVKSPINGTVIKKIGNVGEIGTPGYPILMLADLKNLYVTAEVDETELAKIKPKQIVDFTVDAFPGVDFTGQIISTTKATVSMFSLFPSKNTGDNFTKVVQRIPVKISINDYQGCALLPGMNATVRVHVAR
jgi:multidrug resistance efflux pump